MTNFLNHFEDVKTLLDSNNPFEAMLGPNQAFKEHWSKLDDRGRLRELHTFPDMYLNNNNYYIPERIEMVMRADDNWIDDVLPIVRTPNDQTTVSWHTIIFDKQFDATIAPLAPPPLLTMSDEGDSASMQKHGIAARWENDFITTPTGRSIYMRTIEQMALTIRNSKNFHALNELLACRPRNLAKRHDAGVAFYGGASGYGNFRSLIKSDIEAFGVIQLGKDRVAAKLDAAATQIMSMRGGSGDTWILPEVVLTYLALVPSDQADFYRAGQDGPDRVNDVGNKRNRIGRNKVYSVRSNWMANKNNRSFDPLRRSREVGEYHFMGDDNQPSNPKDYRTRNRDIRIYDFKRDKFVLITLQHALRNCKRFKDDGTLADHPSGKNAKGEDFTLDGDNKNIKTLGNIGGEFISEKHIARMAKVIQARDPNVLKGINFSNIASRIGGFGSGAVRSEKPDQIATLQHQILNTLKGFVHDDNNTHIEIEKHINNFVENKKDFEPTLDSVQKSLTEADKTHHRFATATNLKSAIQQQVKLFRATMKKVGALVFKDRDDKNGNVKRGATTVSNYAEADTKIDETPIKDIPFQVNDLVTLADADIPVPNNVLMLRPHMRVVTAAGIKVLSNGGAGNTYWAKPNMQFENNAQQKTTYGNLSVFYRTIIDKPENVLVVPDIFIYDIGNGSGTKTLKTQRRRGEDPGDIAYILLPANETKDTMDTTIDASGSWSTYIKDKWLKKNKQNMQLHYSTALFYRNLYSWYPRGEGQPMKFTYNTEARLSNHSRNTLCHLGCSQQRDPETGKFYTAELGHGHFKEINHDGFVQWLLGMREMRPQHTIQIMH